MTDDAPECLACGACCFTTLPTAIRVSGDDHARMGDRAEAWTVWLGNRCYMTLADGHCVALTVTTDGVFHCGAYELRPTVCRDLARGGAACAAERHEGQGAQGAGDAAQRVSLVLPAVRRTSRIASCCDRSDGV